MRASYLNKINLGEGFVVPRFLDVEDRDDVFVIKVSQQLHLAKGAKTEHGMIERRDLLDGDLLSGGLVERRAMHIQLSPSSRYHATYCKWDRERLDVDSDRAQSQGLTRPRRRHPRRRHLECRTDRTR